MAKLNRLKMFTMIHTLFIELQYLLLSSRLLLGRSQVMSVELKNEGTLSCDVEIKLTDPHQSFVVMQKCVQVSVLKIDVLENFFSSK